MTTPLAALKRQLNLTGTDDDAQLALFLDAATEHTRQHIGAEALAYAEAPAPLKLAVLMLAAHLYENREATIAGMGINSVPFGYLDFCAAYRAWEFG